ncbi:MAG: hypothetical protein GY855_02160, partial [candidate division Zixibacteria bacterium]|nr:hypothetical protein [candidate division Zixibacteria bacterium]
MKKWNNLLLIITIQIAILLFASVNTSFGEQVVLSIDDTIVIDGDTCVVMNYFMNDSLHSALFLIEQSDTVYCRGIIEDGVPEFDTSIFTPLNPQLGTSWYGMCDGSLFEVDDFLSVSVPAGTFDAYHYSVSGECNEYWQASQGVGIIVIPVEDEFGDEFWVKLSDYTIAGGEGVFPLEVGNRWEYTFVPPESATMRVVNDTT